jgi:hypothetical protein
MKFVAFILSVLFVVFLSCKKENEKSPDNEPQGTNYIEYDSLHGANGRRWQLTHDTTSLITLKPDQYSYEQKTVTLESLNDGGYLDIFPDSTYKFSPQFSELVSIHPSGRWVDKYPNTFMYPPPPTGTLTNIVFVNADIYRDGDYRDFQIIKYYKKANLQDEGMLIKTRWFYVNDTTMASMSFELHLIKSF